ncbi:HMP-PP phosphatase [Paenibacillus konkukensis]|uniref:HMP-PP phosphatase n=1 Tax=Paenibacillus konkukensis TaxID=2020716 RepID=A0ABY4RL48_9BACL|nr:HAD family hydrolase [Paenibacillus konkukensis]UQZ83151.1 HMP-PP phosphatase [Paenibacillus konkukensis]
MIKLIVSDLDGTLLQKGHHIHDRDRQAINEALGRGLDVCFASGRMYPEIRHVMNELGLQVHAVSQNGAYVHTSEGERIVANTFDTGLIRELAIAAEGWPLVTVMCAPEHYVLTELNESNAHIQANLLAPLHVMPHAVEALGGELLCGKITYLGDIARLRVLQKQLLDVYGERIDAYIADVDCLDVMPRHVSKGTGLQALLSYLNLSPEEMLCIGDSFNDVAMFAETPHSFAIAASHPDLKARASHEAQGVADAIAWALQANAERLSRKDGGA